MGEITDEFQYQDENKRQKPRVFLPHIEGVSIGASTQAGVTPDFLKAFMIEKPKLQPVKTKVDSILIKGSKILANHPKSKYIEGTLFHMATAYFFKTEFMPSQQKCIELIERFAEGDYSPDAHLLLAKNYLLQRKMELGRTMLSRTVDVGWYKERWDIVAEAYRIQAELALEEGDLEKALRPYQQAVAQSDDREQQARWQVEVAGLYYRKGKYELAEKNFARVFEYKPDPLAQFEALLYRAASLSQTGDFTEAEKIFTELEKDRKYEEWGSFVSAERLSMDRLKSADPQSPAVIAAERQADSTYAGKGGRPELIVQNFQKGMDLYRRNQYSEALPYFAKAKVIRTPVYETAAKFYSLIKSWEDQHRKIQNYGKLDKADSGLMDSLSRGMGREYHTLGRVHEQMGNNDSAMMYYEKAYLIATDQDASKSMYLFAMARIVRQADPETADSLMTILYEKFPSTLYGREAQSALGYVEDVELDEATTLYRSANSFRMIKDFDFAVRQYLSIVTNHAESSLAPKALYALGWMYEKDIGNNDSALTYYGMLVERYPSSEYAKEIRPSYEFAVAKLNNVTISDSLLLMDLDSAYLQQAKTGELTPLDQLMKNNQNAINTTMPGLSLPPGVNIPGLEGFTSPDGRIDPGIGVQRDPNVIKPSGNPLPDSDTTQGRARTPGRRP